MKKVLTLAAILALTSAVAIAEPTTKVSNEKPNAADTSTMAPATTTPSSEKPANEQMAKKTNHAAKAKHGTAHKAGKKGSEPQN